MRLKSNICKVPYKLASQAKNVFERKFHGKSHLQKTWVFLWRVWSNLTDYWVSIKFEKWKDVLSNDCMKKVYIMQRALFAKVRRAPQPTLLSNRRLYVESFNFFSGSRHLIRFHVKVGRERKKINTTQSTPTTSRHPKLE